METGRASWVVRQPKLYAGACGEKVPRALVRWATRTLLQSDLQLSVESG